MGTRNIEETRLINTQAAGCTGLLGWLVVEKVRDGHATTLGAASGAVAGLVAIPPLAVGAYAFVMTYGIGKLIDRTMGFRAAEEGERSGLDLAVHAESAYDHGVLGHGLPQNAVHRPPRRPDRTPTP